MRFKNIVQLQEQRQAEHLMLIEAKVTREWSTVGRVLLEYKLTPQQIEQIFANAEKGLTKMGGNRTMLGQGKDAVAAVNKAWEDLKTQMQNSQPVANFDKKVNDVLSKIGMGNADPAFQSNVSGWVQGYRNFAKEHPIAQGAIYAVLIALAGLSGAGIAGAAALGLLKMADRVLQGDRFTSALYKGAKTGGAAYALGQLKNHFADQPTGPAVQSPNPSEQFNDYTVAKGDTLSQIAKDNGVSVDALMKSNPEITNPDVIKAGQAIKIPLGDEFVTGNPYQGGVGTASDTMKKIASGEYTPSEISTNAAAKAAGKAATQAADTATDAAMNAPIPADQAPMYQADADQYDDGASQLGQNADMTKVADTNQGRLKMNQWRQETGSPNAKPDVPTDSAPAPDASSAVQGGSPSLSLSDTGNGIKGDLTLPDGSTVPAQAFPADGMQPRMPFGSEKVTVELNGQKVDAWVYNGKAYIKDFDTNTLKAPAPQMPASTGSPFFDRMNRAAANGVRLRESAVPRIRNLTESELKAIFVVSSNQMFKRQAINEGVWDSIKGAAGQAMDWAKTKGHNLTTKITADKLKQAWTAAGSPTDSQKVRDLLVAQGVAAQVADGALKSVATVRGKSTQDRRAAAQGFGPDKAQQQGSAAIGQMASQLSQQPQAQPQAQAQANEPQEWGNQELRDLHMAAGGTFDGQTGKPIPVERNTQRASTQTWGGQAQQAQPAQQSQGTSYEVGSKKAVPAQQQSQGYSSRGIAGMDAAPASQAQPGFMQSKIKKGGWTYQPEMTEEMIASSLSKELGEFMGKREKKETGLKSERLRATDSLQTAKDKAALKAKHGKK